jgi:tetratricopeptide (TPR) repeat protein
MRAEVTKRWFPVAVLFVILVSGGCRSTIDLSTARGQTQFGMQAAKMDLWREAQFRFKRAVELNPGNAMAYNNLAVAYEGIGEYDQAREAYLYALNIDRSNEYIQRNYSRFVEFHSKRASAPPPQRVTRADHSDDGEETEETVVPEAVGEQTEPSEGEEAARPEPELEDEAEPAATEIEEGASPDAAEPEEEDEPAATEIEEDSR